MVFVIDCTATWAPPPMGTSPTFICRLVTGRSRSAASVISLPYVLILIRYERLSSEDFTQVRVGREEEERQDQDEAESGDLAHRLLADGPAQQLLRGYEEQVSAVERQDRKQVEQSQVQADQGKKRQKEPLVDGGAANGSDAHRTGDVLVQILLAGKELPDEYPELDRDLRAPLYRQPDGLYRTIRGRLQLGTHANERPIFILGIRPQLPLEGLLRTVPQHGHTDLLTNVTARHLAFETVPGLYRFAIQAHDLVAGLDPNLLSHRSWFYSTHDGLYVGHDTLEHVNTGQYGDGREEVCHWAGKNDKGPPPQRFGVVGVTPFRPIPHSCHLGKSTQEYYAERVDGLADLLLEESWSEADAELGNPYAQGFGREHVPELVDNYEEDQTHQRHDDGHRGSPPTRLSASPRAQPSTASMDSMLCIIPNSGTSSRTSSITSAICRNLILPSRKACTATSLAALSATG